jgi:hypothetical protein
MQVRSHRTILSGTTHPGGHLDLHGDPERQLRQPAGTALEPTLNCTSELARIRSVTSA